MLSPGVWWSPRLPMRIYKVNTSLRKKDVISEYNIFSPLSYWICHRFFFFSCRHTWIDNHISMFSSLNRPLSCTNTQLLAYKRSLEIYIFVYFYWIWLYHFALKLQSLTHSMNIIKVHKYILDNLYCSVKVCLVSNYVLYCIRTVADVNQWFYSHELIVLSLI